MIRRPGARPGGPSRTSVGGKPGGHVFGRGGGAKRRIVVGPFDGRPCRDHMDSAKTAVATIQTSFYT